MASDTEKGLDERQEQCKKCWEIASEKQNVAAGIFWGKKSRKPTNAKTTPPHTPPQKNPTPPNQPFGEAEVMETQVTFIH